MKTDKLKHLDHLEDLPIRHGEKGFDHAHDTLLNSHEFLKGKTPHDYHLNTKWDGVSVVFGHNDGKFFAGTKSVFNKTPKMNYSIEDIQKNHKDAPGLVKKLSNVFNHLQNAAPKNGIYQGDVLYTDPNDLEHKGSHVSFTPNTLTYHAKKDSPEGQKVLNSKMGIVVHTKYRGDYGESDLGKMTAKFDVDQSKFKHGDVNFIDPKVHNKHDYSIKNEKDFLENLVDSKKLHKKLKDSGSYKTLEPHGDLLLGYINHTVKNKKEPSFSNYISFINKQHNKNIENVKQDKTKFKKSEDTRNLITHITQNKEILEDFFKLHQHLGKAKDVVVNALSKHSPYKHTILDEPSKPEGFVAVHKGIPTKLVDRNEFSHSNFIHNTKVNPEDNPMVISFGKMNVPHKGHEKMVNKVVDTARRLNAKHTVILSNGDKEKETNAKEAFPNTNVKMADEGDGLIQQLGKLHKDGVKHLTVVAGDDRVDEYKKLINKYNGKEGSFNFKKVNVVSAGARDEKSEGIEGLSSTKLRDAAKKGDFATFKKGMPSAFDHEKSKALYNNLRKKMGLFEQELLEGNFVDPLGLFDHPTPKLEKTHNVSKSAHHEFFNSIGFKKQSPNPTPGPSAYESKFLSDEQKTGAIGRIHDHLTSNGYKYTSASNNRHFWHKSNELVIGSADKQNNGLVIAHHKGESAKQWSKVYGLHENIMEGKVFDMEGKKIFHEPTHEHIRSLLDKSDYGEVRGLHHPKHGLFVWDSNDATHHDAVNHLNKQHGFEMAYKDTNKFYLDDREVMSKAPLNHPSIRKYSDKHKVPNNIMEETDERLR